jgi:hypothetical protein
MVRRVNVGAEKGETPRKTLFFNKNDAPSEIDKARREMPGGVRRVSLGQVKGETPRKVYYFNKNDAPSEVEKATPQRGAFFNENEPLKSAIKEDSMERIVEASENDPFQSPPLTDRPTTSRGKARPSPEEFFDYVVPSPDHDSNARKVLKFDENDVNENGDEVEKAAEVNNNPYNTSPTGKTKEDPTELIALACWLFGSALSV